VEGEEEPEALTESTKSKVRPGTESPALEALAQSRPDLEIPPSPKSAGADSLLPCISKSLPPSCPSCPRGTSSLSSPVHRLEPRGRTGPSRGARRRERRRKGKVRQGEEGESEWRPGENGRDDPANEAREKSKGEKELDKGEGGRRLSKGERREPREKATVAAKALRIDPGRERKNQQQNERTTEEELRARKERTSQVESMRREEGRILTLSPLRRKR
jgi:hypothetical protein